MLWLEILGGRIHLSCRYRLVASFGRTSLAWASMRASNPQDGWHRPTCQTTERCFWRPRRQLDRHSPPFACQRLAQKGQNITPYGLDVTFEGHMVVDDELEHDTWHFEVERLQMIATWALEALLCSPAPTTCSICQNVLLQGMTSPLF
jgi:hypothetical protein